LSASRRAVPHGLVSPENMLTKSSVLVHFSLCPARAPAQSEARMFKQCRNSLLCLRHPDSPPLGGSGPPALVVESEK